MADLPVVLVLSPRPVRLQSPGAPPAYETREFDCRWHPSEGRLGVLLARERPDVIVSFGPRAAYPQLEAAPYDVRRRWLHFESVAPSEADLVRAGALALALFVHRALARTDETLGAEPPLVSVFTPTRHPGERLQRPYRSLRRQTHDNWEWVVVDDSDDDQATWRALVELAQEEPRLSAHAPHRPSGRIGEVKRRACALARGAILVELDHDDALMPDALADVVRAFAADPAAGFVYSDWAEVAEDGVTPLRYADGWAFGYGAYREEVHDGRRLLVACAPPLNARTVRHLVSMPNHVRAWRRDAYWRAGGHNAALHVADDYELLVRTFLETRMAHLAKLCYVQYRGSGQSAQDRRRGEIQRLVRHIAEHYERPLHERLLELGLPDPVWDGREPAARPDPGPAAR